MSEYLKKRIKVLEFQSGVYYVGEDTDKAALKWIEDIIEYIKETRGDLSS